jgi:hypothetical protein
LSRFLTVGYLRGLFLTIFQSIFWGRGEIGLKSCFFHKTQKNYPAFSTKRKKIAKFSKQTYDKNLELIQPLIQE